MNPIQENVDEVLTNAVEEWNLSRPPLTILIVTDNTANMVTAVRAANTVFGPHVICFAHKVNLAAQRSLQVGPT